MTGNYVETATITLREGITEDALLAASQSLHTDFLGTQPGFLQRELLKLDGRTYLDLVHWASREAAEAVMEQAATSPACAAFFSLMEMDPDRPDEGVTLYRSLARYSAD